MSESEDRARQPTGGELPRPVVLVVEDEPPLLRAMTRVLRPHFDVVPARSAAEARAAAGVRYLDLILTDYAMADENGIEGLRRLRELGHGAPAVIVTALPGAEVYAALREGLAVAVVEKPWTVDELLSASLRAAGLAVPPKTGRTG